MVKLILCIHRESGPTGKRLEEVIRKRFPEIQQEYHDGIGCFKRRLHLPIQYRKQEICIAFADNRKRLDRLIELKDFFEDRLLVLILPENQRDILSLGHRLLPRYVSNEKDNFKDLVSVLEKMISKTNRCRLSGERNGNNQGQLCDH